MAFDFTEDLEALMDLFGNCTVSITLSGVLVTSFRAILDLHNEIVSPYESNRAILKPVLSALDADVADISNDHVLLIHKDGDITEKEYKFDGKPLPDGAGLTIIHLAAKV